jgi:hypothetical protein
MRTIIKYQGQKLLKGINNALRETIRAHGDITLNFVPSASKRIFGEIKCFNHNFVQNAKCSNNQWLEIYKENWSSLIDKNGNVTVPWSDIQSIINKCIERGEYLENEAD